MAKDYEYMLLSCLLNKPKYKLFIPELKGEMFESKQMGDLFDIISPNDSFPMIVKKSGISLEVMLDMQSEVNVVSESDVKGYAMLIIEQYQKREIEKLPKMGLDDIEQEVRRLKGLTVKEQENKSSQQFLKDLERMYQGLPDLSNIPTGFWQIDKMIRGFRNSELIIIGGRPAMGKSTIGVNIAHNMLETGSKILYYSLEMSGRDLHERLVKEISGIENLYDISSEDFEKCINISHDIDKMPLKILDKAGMTVEDIYSYSMKAKGDNQVDCVFIDHLSILKSRKLFKSRYEEISDISRQLKVMAKDLNVPVVALCQLNRSVETREVKIPTMADLRDSGSIEQDADLICFIHRPEYYSYQRNEEPKEEEKGLALFSISKNRRGGVGCVNLKFNPKIPMFY